MTRRKDPPAKMKCKICEGIILNTEEFVEVVHYLDVKHVRGQGFYHVICYKERVIGNNSEREFYKQGMDVLKHIKGKINALGENV